MDPKLQCDRLNCTALLRGPYANQPFLVSALESPLPCNGPVEGERVTLKIGVLLLTVTRTVEV